MTWKPRDELLWIVPLAFWGGYAVCRWRRPADAGLAEIFLYAGLWLVFPMYGAKLTYLFNTLDYPFRDDLLSGADAYLGFDWDAYAHLTTGTRLLTSASYYVYYSYYALPYFMMAALAIAGVPAGNARFFQSCAIALVITSIVSGFVPSLGPGPTHGFHPPWPAVVANLQSGNWHDQPYIGIVNFPSYHTVMAILAAFAAREVKILRWVVPVWSFGIVAAVPYWGLHYAVDVLGGGATAFAAQLVVERYLHDRRGARAVQERRAEEPART